MAAFLQVSRRFGTNKALWDNLKDPLKVRDAVGSHGANPELWKKVFIFICCPSIAIAFANVVLSEPPPRPEFKKYPHLRIRRKPFPWKDGVKTLFHNPHTNPLPDGYEDEIAGHH